MYIKNAYGLNDVVLGLALSSVTLSKTCSFISYIFFFLGFNTRLGLNTQSPYLLFVVISYVMLLIDGKHQ